MPAYKMATSGSGSLTDAELISLLLTGKTKSVDAARILLSNFENSLSALASANLSQLQRYLTTTEAQRIFAAFELYQRKMAEERNVEKISNSDGAYKLFAPYLNDIDHEQFWIAPMKKNNQPVFVKCAFIGGCSGVVADVKIIIRACLDVNAPGLIISHNHPSGSYEPSRADIDLTKRLKEACSIFEITLIDHIIVARNNGYYSFAKEGII